MFYVKFYWWLYIYCTFASIFSLYIYVQNQYEYSKLWALKDSDNTLNHDYDFIVVGSGSAGSILAGRLAVSQNYKVLLIEAGGEPSKILDIPLVTPLIQRSSHDWQYETVPQSNSCFGLEDRIVRWPMGKVIGGTSRLNFMIYLRGHETDFLNWTDGFHWTQDDILHYFKKSEHHLGEFRDDVVHHGHDGPIYVSDQIYLTGLGDAMVTGLGELGIPKVDLNTMSRCAGAMLTQHTSHMGRRWSSQDALLRGIGVTARLAIATNTRVIRVLMKEGFQAYGVEFEDELGRKGEVRAKQAVILSAGVIGSAKILLQSGIGPKEHLQSLNIKVAADLPVGENLQDHLTTGIDLILLNQTIYPLFKDINPLSYLFSGGGLLGHTICEATALLSCKPSDNQPELQLMALPAGASSDFGTALRENLRLSDKLWKEYFVKLAGRRQAVSIMPVVLHPKSKGTVRLASTDPSKPPLIDPKYLSDPHDVRVLIAGIRVLESLVKTEGMRRLGAELNDQPLPGCEGHTFGSEEYWECYIRHLTLTSYHPVGTCSMGSDPSTSVVDHQLRVHRTQGLYVVDGSVMPTLPSANTQAAVAMVAEKAADLIKEHYYTRFGTCVNSLISFLSLVFVGDVCSSS